MQCIIVIVATNLKFLHQKGPHPENLMKNPHHLRIEKSRLPLPKRAKNIDSHLRLIKTDSAASVSNRNIIFQTKEKIVRLQGKTTRGLHPNQHQGKPPLQLDDNHITGVRDKERVNLPIAHTQHVYRLGDELPPLRRTHPLQRRQRLPNHIENIEFLLQKRSPLIDHLTQLYPGQGP